MSSIPQWQWKDAAAMLESNTNMQAPQHFQEVLSILNSRNMATRTKGITKSFRLDEDILKKLNEQARNNNTSLNAEINSILRKYIDWDMLASKVGMIPVARPVLSEIFQNIMTKEQVIDLADKVSKEVIHETAHFMKGSLTLESFLSWLKTRMEYCSKVNCMIEDNYNNINPQIKLIFKHDLGKNWSIYHKIVLDYIFYHILRKTNVQIEASDSTLILCLK
jgi:hypothetical protein